MNLRWKNMKKKIESYIPLELVMVQIGWIYEIAFRFTELERVCLHKNPKFLLLRIAHKYFES